MNVTFLRILYQDTLVALHLVSSDDHGQNPTKTKVGRLKTNLFSTITNKVI